jgi:hypothetical protein
MALMKYVGGIEVFSEPLKIELGKQIQSQENIVYCMAPRSSKPDAIQKYTIFGALQEQNQNWLDGIAALENRCIIFGGVEMLGKVRIGTISIEYLDTKSIEVTKPVNLSRTIRLEINGNTIVMPVEAENEVRTFAEWLREKVRNVRMAVETQREISPSTNLATELEKLASLHKNGVLSDAEFEVAKRRILGI